MAIALAVLLGLALFPLVLVFGPVYFPWSLLVLFALGGAVGLAISPPSVPRTLGLAILMVLVVFAVLTVTMNIGPASSMFASAAALASLLVSTGSLLLPLLVGAATGATLRAHWSVGFAAAAGVSGLFAIALIGAGLAYAFAPSEIAAAPRCADSVECPRTWCAQMAERRRLFTVERVVAWDGNRIRCSYTGWGGVSIGQADVGFSGGGGWTDGAWPRLLSGR